MNIAYFHSFNNSFNCAVKNIHSKNLFIQQKMQIIHSKNLFIQSNPKLFIQKKYSFKWKRDYRPGLLRGGHWTRVSISSEKKWLIFFSLELENCIFISLSLLYFQDFETKILFLFSICEDFWQDSHGFLDSHSEAICIRINKKYTPLPKYWGKCWRHRSILMPLFIQFLKTLMDSARCFSVFCKISQYPCKHLKSMANPMLLVISLTPWKTWWEINQLWL